MSDCPFTVRSRFSRRTILRGGTALAGGLLTCPLLGAETDWSTAPSVPAAAPVRAPTASRAPLARPAFQILPLGSIKPAGWLARQMRLQADGLGGHVDETWDDLGPHSGWLGKGGESWERGPYFIDGLVALAWQLDDIVLKTKAQRWIDWTLENQRPDGMFGPRKNTDWWPLMVMLKALTQYHEATEDPRVIPFMTRYFHFQLGQLPSKPLESWGMMRWQDEVVSVLWLFDRTGDAKLIELAKLLQRQGFRWDAMYANFPYKGPAIDYRKPILDPALLALDPSGDAKPNLYAHGVNHAQSLKAGPVWYRVSGKSDDRDLVHRQLALLDQYHGLPNGMYSADEHLSGRSPSQGTEVCTVVETLYACEYAMAITGSAKLGDRIEKIAFNALPAGLSEDMWTHQYDQQPNQIRVSVAKGPWISDGPEANLFGLDPHFGCCTANFHQGWPKLTASLWMASTEGGLVATLYAPCAVRTVVNGVPVEIEQSTDYPFRHDVKIALKPASVVRFPLRLRIPGWSTGCRITVNGAVHRILPVDGYARIDREWRPGDIVEISFQSLPQAVPGHNGSLSFEDGALVFVLPVGEDWRKLRTRGLTNDWQIFPTTPWAYAVRSSVSITRVVRPVGPVPFSRRDPPVVLLADAYAIETWNEFAGSAADVPTPSREQVAKVPTRVTLMPYGAPKLRLTAFAKAPTS